MQRKPALGLSIALGSLALAGPVDAQWTTSRSDNHRSSRSEVYASQAASPLYPVADVGARPAAGVVQGPSGLVYFSRTTDLQARDPETGAIAWTTPFSSTRTYGGPSLGPGETLCVPWETAGVPGPLGVVKLDSAGSELWTVTYTVNTGALPQMSHLAVDAAGNVYGRFTENPYTNYTAFCLDAAGNELWSTTVPVGIFSMKEHGPALGDDGAVYYTDNLVGLTRLDGATGAVDWTSNPGGALSSPVIADNGLVLVHTAFSAPSPGLYAYDPLTGAQAWQYPYPSQANGDLPPSLLQDGEALVIAPGAGGTHLHRVDVTDGSGLGSIPLPVSVADTEPVVGGDDTIYLWSGLTFVAFSPASGITKFQYAPAAGAGCVQAETVTPLADGSIFLTWRRKQTCNVSSGLNQFGTLAAPEGQPPVCTANIGPSAIIAEPDSALWPGTSVLLDGTGSSDPDNGIAFWEWRALIGTTPGPVLSSEPTYTLLTADPSSGPLQQQYLLRVVDPCDVLSADTLSVTILPVGTVVAPAPGEIWPIGSTPTIEWLAGNAPTGRVIQLSRDGGPWEDLALGTPNDGAYDWTVTGPATSNAVLRIFPAGAVIFAQYSEPFTITDGATGIGDVAAIGTTRLLGASPNPSRFTDPVRVRFELARSAHASVRIYDLRGARVRTLLDGVRPAGSNVVVWDRNDDAGRPVAAGVYFYRFESGEVRSTEKVSLVR
ncbi:MAG: PQQ-binding-like beta-propeller repeat protein [Gemmatimonadetes bacterium]|nr:PQQ-binding-like beta-propeller repeat protein [Gemmatimonadota bacterium]